MSNSSDNYALKYRALAEAIMAAAGGAGIETVAEKALGLAIADLNLAAGALLLWDDLGKVQAKSIVAEQEENRQVLLDIENTVLVALRRDHELNTAYLELGGETPRAVFSLPIEADGRQFGALIGISVAAGRLDDLITDTHHRFLRTLAALLTMIPDNEEKAKAIRYSAIDELAVGVNHMINNPLTPLIGNLELLNKEKPDLPESVRRKLAVIEDSANQIREVTAKLMQAAEAPSIEYINGKRMVDLSSGKTKKKTDDDKRPEDEKT